MVVAFLKRLSVITGRFTTEVMCTTNRLTVPQQYSLKQDKVSLPMLSAMFST